MQVLDPSGHLKFVFIIYLAAYPKYCAGAGFILNWKAVEIVQAMIGETPLISIDDAFIGICMAKAGYEDNVFPLSGFSLDSRIDRK